MIIFLCLLATSMTSVEAGPVVVYPPLPGVPSEIFEVQVADAKPPVAYFAGSLDRGVGPAATNASVVRFGLNEDENCTVRFPCTDSTRVLLHQIGESRWIDSGAEDGKCEAQFTVEPETSYALNIVERWLFIWVDAPLEDEPEEYSFGPGEFVSEPFSIKTPGSELTLAPGAVLRLTNESSSRTFVTVLADDVRIRGVGVIDTNGIYAHGVYAEDCKRFTLEDVFFVNSGSWAVLIRNVSDVQIRNIKVFSGADGIDLDGSRHAVVTGSIFINSWDDAIVVKTTQDSADALNITVSKAQVLTRKSAYKVGTESMANFRDIQFNDIQGYDLDRGASIYLRDGGHAFNVTFQRLAFFFKAWDDDDEKIFGTALDFELQRRNSKSKASTLVDLHVSDAVLFEPSINAALLKGLDDAWPLIDVRLTNLTVFLAANDSKTMSIFNHKKKKSDFLFECKNTYISNASVLATNVSLIPSSWWTSSEDALSSWPDGLAPGWPTHDVPPSSFEICRHRRFDDDSSISVS